MEAKISRGILLWMGMISSIFLYIVQGDTDPIFNFGPNENLFILGILINDQNKYCSVVAFCFVNSGIRVLNHNILTPYIINTIQNKACLISHNSYEISLVSAIYTWFDFFMFITIAFAQMDLFLIEIFSDIIVTVITTRYFLQQKEKIELVNIVTSLIKRDDSIYGSDE